jgi:hypothetical protein
MRLLDMEKGERPYLGDFLDRWRKMQKPVFVPGSTEHPSFPSAAHIPSEHILP